MRLSGFGGQGIILAGVIMAKAAVEQDGIHATQTQSYGAESRGGACMANVVLSQEKIDYPEPEELDILVALSQSALDRHIGDLLPGGTLIVDSDRRVDGSSVSDSGNSNRSRKTRPASGR
jgi:2-oxoglutarate ferredoxin oxidoreductase subunit gamma